MRSQTPITSAMLWSINSTPVSCSSRRERTTAANSGTSASGSPAAGSSISTNDGSVASTRATPRRRSSPCESAAAPESASGASPRSRSRWSARRRAAREPAPTPSAATSTFSRTERPRNERLCWNVRARPARARRGELQPVIARPPSSTVPSSGLSKPVSTFTSVDLPAPFGPISPTTSCRASSSVTSLNACTPSKDRETEEARSVSPGLLSVLSVTPSCLEVRDDLRRDRTDVGRLVVLDLHHAVLAAEDRVELLREADLPAEHCHVLELFHLRGEGRTLQRPVRPLDREEDAVDRVGAAEEAARERGSPGRLQRADHLAHVLARIVAEDRRVGDVVVVRHLRALRHPVGAVAGPRVEDRRVVVQRADARHERRQLAERGRRHVDRGLVRVQPRDGGVDVVGAGRVALAGDDLAAQRAEALVECRHDVLEVDEQRVC